VSAEASSAAAAERDLAGRIAVVTGGGHGLGRAIALGLAAAGADVAIAGRDPGPLESTAAELSAHGVAACGVECDVAEADAIERLHDEVAGKLGTPSILVANAGVAGPTAPLTEIEPEEWDAVMASNVRSAFLSARAFLPAMLAAGSGDVIFIGSVAAKRPLARRTPYCASKAALSGLTRSLALEVGPTGVRVNCLSPGPVAGPRMDAVFEREASATGSTYEEAEAAYVSKAAAERLVREDEVAEGVLAILRSTALVGVELDLSAGMFT
jgi:NAD(P)-dependent dehydrogenase (short-subunit alcohol dehydrogenase family)